MQRSYSPTSPYMNTTYASFSQKKGGFSGLLQKVKFMKLHLSLAATVCLVAAIVLGYYGAVKEYNAREYEDLPDVGKKIYDFNQSNAGKLVFMLVVVFFILSVGGALHGHGYLGI